MKFTPYARFKHDEYGDYRIETYLSVNEKESFNLDKNCIGTVIMTNPGSSKPLGNYDIIDRATEDPTMKMIKECVLKAYQIKNKKLYNDGHIQIFNLFNFCEEDMNEAVKFYKNFKNQSSFMESDLCIHPNTPWIWIAWGCKYDELDERRGVLYKVIAKFSKKIVCVSCDNNQDKKRFWHPYRFYFKKNYGIKNNIINQLVKL